jgi:serine-type anaerobic sulfatase-maturating enzyme
MLKMEVSYRKVLDSSGAAMKEKQGSGSHNSIPLTAPLNFHLLAKPAGAACNLSCKYCFFLSKENLYPERQSPLMDEETLHAYIRQLMETTAGPEVQVSWQGGEPMLRGLNFFRRSVDLANLYRRPHQHIQHTIQTNGTLIDDQWATFFKQHNYLVGLSIDGPRKLHDAYRIGKDGEGSFDDAIRGWNILQKHAVDVNILCTIHAANANHPLEVYRFFRDELNAKYIQMIPIVERATSETIAAANQGWGGLKGKDRPLYKQEGNLVTERTVLSESFGSFLIAIFDEWVKRDVGTVYVTTFDVALGSWLGQHNSCIIAPTCGSALVLEHNGDVYSCDHFVEPDHRLGNVNETPLKILITSEKQRRFGQNKYDTLPKYCRECPVLFACYGECPRNRFIQTPDGDEGLNYLCAGYKSFFTHIDAPMKTMAGLLQQGRYADEIMTMC